MNMVMANRTGGALDTVRQLPKDTGTTSIPLVRQYLRIALRWKFVILGAVAACMAIGLILTLLTTPKYTATATVEIARESSKVTDFQGVEREASTFDQEFYQTQYGLLRSRALAERVANQLRLVDDPKFFEMFKAAKEAPAFREVNGRYTLAGRAERQRIAGEVLLKNAAINPTRLSRLVDIGFTSPDAAFSARVANAWAENFIQTNLERKVQATAYGRDLLQRQLALQKQRLDDSQRQLVAYASAQQIINLPAQGGGTGGTTTVERSIVADDLASLNSALSQATADRIQAEARSQQAGRAGASTEALRNTAINSLRQRRAELAAAPGDAQVAQQILVQIALHVLILLRDLHLVDGLARLDQQARLVRHWRCFQLCFLRCCAGTPRWSGWGTGCPE